MRKSAIGILLLLLIIVGCSQKPEDKISSLYDEGLAKLDEGDFTSAFEKFEAIKKTDAASGKWQLGEAIAYKKRFQFYDAINAYLMLIEFHPTETEAYLNAAELYHLLGYNDEAVWTLQDYRKVAADNVEILLEEAKCQLFLEDPKLAGEALERIGDRYPDSDVPMIYTAAQLSQMGKAEEAAQIINQIKPESAQSFEALADYYELNYVIDSAIYFSIKAYQKSDNDFDQTLKHIFRLNRYGYLSDSRLLMDQLAAQSSDSVLLVGLDFLYYKALGSNTDIQTAGNKYFALSSNTITGKMYQLEGTAAGNNLIGLDQELKVFKSGYYDKIAAPAIKPFLHYKIFLTFHQGEYINSNLEELEQFDNQRKSTRAYQLELAKSKYVTGEFEAAQKMFDQYEKLHSNEPVWLAELADIYAYIKLDFLNDAVRLDEEALKLNPHYVKAFKGLIKANILYKKYKEAASYFKKYPQFNNNPSMLLLKAEVNIWNGEYEKSYKNFELGFKRLNGPTAEAKAMLDVLKKRFRITEADKIVNMMVNYSPENPDVLTIAADFYSNHGQPEKGLELADKALQLGPQLPSAQVQKAVAQYFLGEKTDAIAALEQIDLEHPRFSENLYYLARFLAFEHIDDRKAQNLGRRAVNTAFGDPYYVLNLSDIYYITGRYDLAFGEARKVVRADRFNPFAHYRLGMAASYLDRDDIKDEALKALDKSEELGLPKQYSDSLKSARARLK